MMAGQDQCRGSFLYNKGREQIKKERKRKESSERLVRVDHKEIQYVSHKRNTISQTEK
jgi:hypothetical protein